jgi:hypothetical protein
MLRKDIHFLGEAGLAMGVPGDGAVGRVGSQADPLVAGGAEDPIGLELGDVRIRAEVLDAFLLGPLGPSALGRGVGEGLCGRLGGVDDSGLVWRGRGRVAAATMGIPVVGGKVVGVVAEGDRVAAVVAEDAVGLVLLGEGVLGFRGEGHGEGQVGSVLDSGLVENIYFETPRIKAGEA